MFQTFYNPQHSFKHAQQSCFHCASEQRKIVGKKCRTNWSKELHHHSTRALAKSERQKTHRILVVLFAYGKQRKTTKELQTPDLPLVLFVLLVFGTFSCIFQLCSASLYVLAMLSLGFRCFCYLLICFPIFFHRSYRHV